MVLTSLAAIAANLANGLAIEASVEAAVAYVHSGIRTAHDIGHGNGPINHFCMSYMLPYAQSVNRSLRSSCSTNQYRGQFVDYLLARPEVKRVWQQYVEHDFVSRLAVGSLPLWTFKQYLVQDYKFLV